MDQIASLNKAHERIEALERENKLLRGTATQSKRIHELWTKSLADLKETRNKLQSSRDFLELLLGTAPLPIFVLSRYGRIMLSNKAGESLLHAGDQSVSGQNALRYLISEDRCSLLNALRSDGGQHASSIEVRIEVAGHPGRLLEMYWASLPESTEGLGRVIVVAMDITERKRMEREREQLQKDLVRVSREAGMAEVAAGVLHNVGNALTSLNVSATIASEKIRKFRIAGLRQVVDLFEEKGDGLGEFLAHDQKGRQLPAYLGKLSDNLTQERESIDRELDSALRDIEHIKRVIATQQSYAFPTTVIEPVQISELLDDAVRMSVSGRHSVKIVREYADVPLVKTDRHALLQVIINLIKNAKESLNEKDEDKVLSVRLMGIEGGHLRIEVEDNGVGVPKENLVRIFEHGFSTKSDGHGFGLHMSANMLKSLGGAIGCISDGPGAGALFWLTIPLTAETI